MTRTPHRISWGAAVIALLAAAAGLSIAMRHPMGAGVVALWAAAGAISARWPSSGLWVLPALLPVLGLSTWTGWTGVEEVDLLTLAVVAGACARLAWRPPTTAPSDRSALTGLMLLLFAASTLVSLARGVADAGGWHFDWTQGPREPLAALRLAKPLFEALLLWAVWRHVQRVDADGAARRLSLGLALALLGASLAALWERLAFTGLLNFSTDYRTTALFWEMHVGGAALDGLLALTVPFALREWLAARTPLRWLAASAVLLLGLYACLTTFSRGVYLGIPVGLAVMLVLNRARERRAGAAPAAAPSVAVAVLALLTFGAAAAWMFPTSGYRGMFALWGAFALLLPLGSLLGSATRGEQLAGAAFGLVAAGVAIAGGWLIPKGAYLMYSGCAAVTLAAVVVHLLRPAERSVASVVAIAGWTAMPGAVAMVALHWGGVSGLQRALPGVVVLVLGAVLAGVIAARSRRPPWPAAWRWQGALVAALVLTGSGVGVLQGGAYLSDRFATAGDDLSGRRAHWNASLDLLQDPLQWAFGLGLGRFPAQFALTSPINQRPADHRFVLDRDGGRLALASGTHVNGWGELFRVSQRVAAPDGDVRAAFAVRSAEAIAVHLEVCEKHLLYNGNCLVQEVVVPADPAGAATWRSFETRLSGGMPTRGAWFAPRLIVFSIGVSTGGRRAEFDRISLTDGGGRELLRNGDFEQRGTHWYVTSDRHHLPWHAKNMALHVLIEQGLVGAALLLALLGAAAYRTTFGGGRDNPLAPPIAGALAGFVVVGLTDSLLDAARIALLFLLLVLVALNLRSAPGRGVGR